MSLPQIPIDQPITKPATVERTYDSMSIVRFTLHTPTPPAEDSLDRQGLTIVLRPYDYSAKTLYPAEDRDVTEGVANIWEEAARSGLFAQVMGGLVMCCSLLSQERRLKRQRNAALAARDQATLDAVDAALAQIWEASHITPEELPVIGPVPEEETP